MGQNQNNTGNSSKIASIFGKRRIAQSQPVSMIMDSNAPVAPAKKKVPIIPIVIIAVAAAVIFGIIMLIINSIKSAKSEALSNAYVNCVSVFYDDGKTPSIDVEATQNEKLGESLNHPENWYAYKINKDAKKYNNYEKKTFSEKVASCVNKIKAAYDESWQKEDHFNTLINDFSNRAIVYADYLKSTVNRSEYVNFYLGQDNSYLENEFKEKEQSSERYIKGFYGALLKRYNAEKDYVTFLNKNHCIDDNGINNECEYQLYGSQIYGKKDAQKNKAIITLDNQVQYMAPDLVRSLMMIGNKL